MDEREGNPNTPRPVLPIWATVREAYTIWYADLGTWLKLLMLPTGIVVCSILLLSGKNIGLSAGVRETLSIFGVYLLLVPMITSWHRLILVKESSFRDLDAIGYREMRYIGVALAISVAGAIYFFVVVGTIFELGKSHSLGGSEPGAMNISYFFDATMALAVLIYFYSLAALSLYFPAAAIGRKLSFREVLAKTAGNRWRLIVAYTLVMTPLALIGFVFQSIPQMLVKLMDVGSVLLVANLIDYLVTVIQLPPLIAVASIAYRELVQKPEAAGATSGATPDA